MQAFVKRYSKKSRQQKIQATLSTDMSLPMSPIQVKATNKNIANDNNIESLDEIYNIDHPQDEPVDKLMNIVSQQR